MKRRVVSLLLAVFSAVVLMGVSLGTTSASAGALRSPAAAARTALNHDHHLANVPAQQGVFDTVLVDGQQVTYPCTAGETWSPRRPISVVSNDCKLQVKLYEYFNHTGWEMCISPGEATGLPANREYPGAIYITHNAGPCP